MTTITLDRPAPDLTRLSKLINELAALIGALPTLDGTQQGRIVEVMVALRCAGVAMDALVCAVEDAAREVESWADSAT